jgi:hypothetical protein
VQQYGAKLGPDASLLQCTLRDIAQVGHCSGFGVPLRTRQRPRILSPPPAAGVGAMHRTQFKKQKNPEIRFLGLGPACAALLSARTGRLNRMPDQPRQKPPPREGHGPKD